MATCVLRWLTRRTTSTAASRGLRVGPSWVSGTPVAMTKAVNAQVRLLAVDEVGNLEVERQVGLVQRWVASAFCGRSGTRRQSCSPGKPSAPSRDLATRCSRGGGARTDVGPERLTRRGRVPHARRGPGGPSGRPVVRGHPCAGWKRESRGRTHESGDAPASGRRRARGDGRRRAVAGYDPPSGRDSLPTRSTRLV